MELYWLPNWRNKSEYPDPKKTTLAQWAWEFLRRNPEYQRDFQAIKVDAKWLDLKYEGSEENRKAWDRLHTLAKKYGLAAPALFDPSKPEPGIFFAPDESSPPSILHVNQEHLLEYIRPVKLERCSEAILKFDLSVPLEFQLEKAEWMLRKAQRKVKVKQNRNQSVKYLTYLRLLDAETSGANISDMAEEIFPHVDNSYPSKHGDKDVRNGLKAAKQLREAGYRYFKLNKKAWSELQPGSTK